MTLTTDRRAALKARHRQAILDAARSLATERGSADFSVDDLAERADVARRTVFNHFASLDAILLAVCELALDDVIAAFLDEIGRIPVGDGSRSAMFDELSAAIRGTDLPAAIVSIHELLGAPTDDDKGRALTQTAFARVTQRLRDEVLLRHPAADRLDAALLVDSLMSGIVLVADHWIQTTGPGLDADARAAWDALLTRLTTSVRSGYLPGT